MNGRQLRLHGRVTTTGPDGFFLDSYRVQIRAAGQELARLDVEDDGRFSVDIPVSPPTLVHVILQAPWELPACGQRVLVDGMREEEALVLPAPLAATSAATPVTDPVAPPPQPLVSEDALARFYRAVSVAERGGSFSGHFGPLEETGWIHFYANELERIEELAQRVAQGAVNRLEEIRQLLADAPRLQTGSGSHHRHDPEGPDGYVAAHTPVEIVAAGLLLHQVFGSQEQWPARAAGFYLRRIDAINRAFGAADRLLARQIDHREFQRLVRAAGPGPAPHEHTGMQAAEPAHDVELDHLDRASRGLGHCLSVLLETGRSTIEEGDHPVLIGAVEPRALCGGHGGRGLLRATPGASLPPAEDAAGSLALWDGARLNPLEVLGWGTDTIEVRFPKAVAPGPAGVLWRAPAVTLVERLADAATTQDASCRPFLSNRPASPSLPPGQVVLEIISPPIIRLTANSQQGELVAEAGADVVLEWTVSTAGEAGAVRARLLAGEDVVLADAGRVGRVVVSNVETQLYRLNAETLAGSATCATATAQVRVVRQRHVSLAIHDRIYRPGEPLAADISIGYPDPVHEVEVELRSSNPAVLPDASAAIPPGSTMTTVYLIAGTAEGTATITARLRPGDADGGDADGADPPREAVQVQVGRSSCTEPRYGGSWEPVRLTVTEPADPCPPATLLSRAGSTQLGYAGARLLDAASSFASIPDCWANTGAAIEACSTTEAGEQAACDSAHQPRLATCQSIQCAGFTDCDSIQCTGFTNCDDYWVIDPRRYACYAARAACVVGAAIARGACWVARGACLAAAAVARGACIAGSAVLLAACKGAAWTKSAACKAVAVVAVPICVVGKVAIGVVHVVVAIGHIVVGVLLNTAGAIARAACTLGRSIGVNLAGRPTTSTRLRVVGIHLAVLHTGKVLIFNYDEGNTPVTPTNPADPAAVGDSDRALCALWDPVAGTARYLPLTRNLFCSGHGFTADGKLFVAGGQFRLPGLLKSLIPPRELAPGADKDLHLFDPIAERWTRMERDMEKGRWYPTCVTMPDGNAMIASGTNAIATQAGFDGGIQHTWKIVNPTTGDVGPDQGFSRQPIFHNYPFMHTLPSGEIFIHYKKITRFFRAVGGWGLMQQGGGGGAYGGEGTPELTQYEFSRTGPGPGSSVLLPLVPQRDLETGLPRYPAGRILIMGGGGAEAQGEPPVPGEVYQLGPTTPATKTAEVLDLDERPLRWRYTGRSPARPGPTDKTTSPMKFARVMPDPVILPDGKVLVVNGAQTGQSGGFLSHMRGAGNVPPMGATDPAQAPELFDPELETWETLCPKTIERLYHATAVLLPDARVLVAGHDGFLNMSPHDSSQYDLELFSPPYLHRGTRPTITSAPERVVYGTIFDVGTPDAPVIGSVCLIRQSSTTHQINTDQRYVGLSIQSVRPDGTLVLHAPPDGGAAPPGFYMLFVVTRDGVPSVAKWVQLGPAEDGIG